MRTFRLIVAYDGGGFHGWQAQPAQRTVQGTLESALAGVLAEENVRLAGAGRTDAGVHARGQVASFESETRLPVRALAAELARRLPDDLRVRAVDEVAEGFHARHRASGRRYAYRLLREDDPLLGRMAWRPRHAAPPDALERATRTLEGAHDCSSFQASGGTPVNPVCRITRARWRAWEWGVQLDMIADHFLYHMVRTVVGTALAVAGERDPAAAMRAVLAARDRRRASVTAPPQGLCLEEVFYGPRRGA